MYQSHTFLSTGARRTVSIPIIPSEPVNITILSDPGKGKLITSIPFSSATGYSLFDFVTLLYKLGEVFDLFKLGIGRGPAK